MFHYIITKSISEISTDGTEDENAATSSAFKKARSEFKNPAKYVERGIFNVLKFNFWYVPSIEFWYNIINEVLVHIDFANQSCNRASWTRPDSCFLKQCKMKKKILNNILMGNYF